MPTFIVHPSGNRLINADAVGIIEKVDEVLVSSMSQSIHVYKIRIIYNSTMNGSNLEMLEFESHKEREGYWEELIKALDAKDILSLKALNQ